MATKRLPTPALLIIGAVAAAAMIVGPPPGLVMMALAHPPDEDPCELGRIVEYPGGPGGEITIPPGRLEAAARALPTGIYRVTAIEVERFRGDHEILTLALGDCTPTDDPDFYGWDCSGAWR